MQNISSRCSNMSLKHPKQNKVFYFILPKIGTLVIISSTQLFHSIINLILNNQIQLLKHLQQYHQYFNIFYLSTFLLHKNNLKINIIDQNCRNQKITIEYSLNIPSMNIQPSIQHKHQYNQPLLDPNPHRFVLFPIQYPNIYKIYKKYLASFWTTAEFDFTKDNENFNNYLNPNEQHIIKMIIGYLLISQNIFFKNTTQQLCSQIQIPEARCFYGFQIAKESIHLQTLSVIIDTFVHDFPEKQYLIKAISDAQLIKKKHQWIQHSLSKSRPFNQRIILYAIIKEIFFAGIFAVTFWFKSKNILLRFIVALQLFYRDFTMERKFACHLYKQLNHLLEEKEILGFIEEAVSIQKQFILEFLPISSIKICPKQMSQYIQYVGDRLLNNLGCKKIYNTRNYLDWMEVYQEFQSIKTDKKGMNQSQKAGKSDKLKDLQFTVDAQF